MFETFFSLARRPFFAHPHIAQFCPLPAHSRILDNLADCVERIEGVGLLVGESGLGKTLLCELLIERLQNSLHGVLLTHTNLPTKLALLQCILFQLRQPYLGFDEQEARLGLMSFLSARPAAVPPMLLVVDEAHGLSGELLEELRLLTNWSIGGDPLIRLVLAGRPLLEEHLGDEQSQALNQRIARRDYLMALTEEETVRYIDDHLHRAGAEGERAFTAEAMEAIYQATDGVPRQINLLCDYALTLGASRRVRPVTTTVVRTSWADLQQLPVSWGRADQALGAAVEGGQHVVEFGQQGGIESPPLPSLRCPPTDVVDQGISPGVCRLEAELQELASSSSQIHTAGSMTTESDVVPTPAEPAIALEAIEPAHGGETLKGPAAAYTRTPSEIGSGHDAGWIPVDCSGRDYGTGDAAGPQGDDRVSALFEKAEPLGIGGVSEIAGQGIDRSSQQPILSDGPFVSTAGEAADDSPLDAAFDEEEAVLDQYAAMDAEVERRQPSGRPSDAEGTPPADAAQDASGPRTPPPARQLAFDEAQEREASRAARAPAMDCRHMFSTLGK